METRGAHALNFPEARPPQQFLLIPNRDRAPYSLRPSLPAPEEMAGELALPHYIGELQPPTWLQNPEDFAEEARLIGSEIDYPVGDRHCKSVVRERQALPLDLADRDMGEAGLAEIVPGQFDHLRGEIDAGHLPIGTDQPGGDQQIKPRATAEVENPFAGLDLTNGKRIADPAKGVQHFGRGGGDGGGIVAQGFGPGSAGGVSEFAGG